MESIRLAYKDMEEEMTKQINSSVDPKKAGQIERLGMGVARNTPAACRSRDLRSHSAMTDMFTIEQEPAPGAGSGYSQPTGSSLQPSCKLDLIDRNYDRFSKDYFVSRNNSSSSASCKKLGSESMDDFWDALESVTSTDKSCSTSSASSSRHVVKSVPEVVESSRRSQSSRSAVTSSTTDEAQKKFGKAKAISSTQYFGDDKQSDFEDKARLSRFAGANSLSSDQLFGREEKAGSRLSSSAASNLISGANLYDMKEGVKEGVTRVGGRLSNLASDLMSSVQEKYGGY